MRCKIGKKKIKKYREQTGLDIIHATTRGGTDHRIDLMLSGGNVIHLYKDGTFGSCEIKWQDKINGIDALRKFFN